MHLRLAPPRGAFGVAIAKLYLFLNAIAFQKHKEDRSGRLAKAEENWPGMHRVAVGQVNS